jgi:hypothetical protein
MNRVQASISVAGDGFFSSNKISNFGSDGTLNDAGGTAFAESLSRTFAVNEGDVLRISIAGLAQAGDYPTWAENREPLSSFFDAHSRIAGQFAIHGDGVTLIPDDGSLSSVPLPAGLPLLLAGLGVLGTLRVRQAKVKDQIDEVRRIPTRPRSARIGQFWSPMGVIESPTCGSTGLDAHNAGRASQRQVGVFRRLDAGTSAATRYPGSFLWLLDCDAVGQPLPRVRPVPYAL